MSNKELEKYLEDISNLTEKLLSSKKAALKHLVDAGINTPTGRLTKMYKE